MKNSLLLATAILATAAAQAQTPTTPAQPTTPDSTQKTSPVVPTTISDTAANAAYVANPDELKGLKTEGLRNEHFFPVLGRYAASGTATGEVTIVLDSANKGIVWVEGLSQGRFKAVMKKAPAIYKVPAQTTESGKAVAEGTLFYNPSSKEVTIVLGRSFNEADPTALSTASPAGKSKTKANVFVYTGAKSSVAAGQ